MSDQKVNDVRAEIDRYLVRHGMEVNTRNRANVAQGVKKWRDGYRAFKADELKAAAAPKPIARSSAQDEADVAEWLSAINKKRKQDADRLDTGVGQAPLEIGFGPGQVSFGSAVEAAKIWREQRQQAVNAAREQEVVRAASEQQAEDARVHKLLHEPDTSAIYEKYRHAVQPLSLANLETYSQHWTVDELRRQAEAARNIAALEVANVMTGEVTNEEWRMASDWIDANNLDPTFASSWGIAITVLVEDRVIRKRDVPKIKIIPDPERKIVPERPAEERLPQGRAAQEAQRLADTLREIRQTLGSYLTEIEIHDSVNPAEDAVVFNLYDSLLGREITRDAVRKAFFYAALKIRGSRPSGFRDSEIETWATDQPAMHQVSASEYKRQMAMFGDVRVSRVPDPTASLLKEIVKNTARTG
jgi:hypothetical protein